jgi:hypothetical protein
MRSNVHWLVVFACAAALAAPLSGCSNEYEFEDVAVGDGDVGREPRARTNSQFVRAVYADILGRSPEIFDFVATAGGQEVFRFPVDEQELLVNALDGNGDPAPMRSLLVTGLLSSDEVDLPRKSEVDDPEEFIRDQFRTLLGREPGVYELEAFASEWESDPAVNPRTVIRALIGSREYQSF